MKNALKKNFFPIALILPSVILIGTLTIFPIFYNVYLSFYQKHAFLNVQKFVLFSNYTSLLSDAEFWDSFKNGIIYSLSTIFLQIALGLSCALLLNEKFKGRNFFRGALLFPYLIPTIVVVILWKWLLNSSYGLIRYLMEVLHITSEPIVWFSEENIMLTLILVSVWQFFPFVLVTILARLQTIPEELYNAAKVDGASAFSRFIHITLPQLKNVLLTIILLRSIWMFTKFDTVWLLAGSESIGKYIQTLPVYTFRKTFIYLEAGAGAALSVVMLAILLSGTIIYIRAFMNKEDALK